MRKNRGIWIGIRRGFGWDGLKNHTTTIMNVDTSYITDEEDDRDAG